MSDWRDNWAGADLPFVVCEGVDGDPNIHPWLRRELGRLLCRAKALDNGDIVVTCDDLERFVGFFGVDFEIQPNGEEWSLIPLTDEDHDPLHPWPPHAAAPKPGHAAADRNPMNPERLRLLREQVQVSGPLMMVERSDVMALLGDRDDARAGLDYLARLTGSAIARATVIAPGEKVIEHDEAIAGDALTGAVEKLRARAEQAERERDEARAELSESDEALVSALADSRRLLDEVARLRARVRVEARDVADRVTSAQAEAWLRANGWTPGSRGFYRGQFGQWHRKRSRFASHDTICVFADGDRLATAIGDVARHHERPGLDILDEMAAMPEQSP